MNNFYRTGWFAAIAVVISWAAGYVTGQQAYIDSDPSGNVASYNMGVKDGVNRCINSK